MYRIGLVLLWIGIVLVAVGMIFGFGGMVLGAGPAFVNLIGLVPWGFLLLLTGMVGTQLANGRGIGASSDKRFPD